MTPIYTHSYPFEFILSPKQWKRETDLFFDPSSLILFILFVTSDGREKRKAEFFHMAGIFS